MMLTRYFFLVFLFLSILLFSQERPRKIYEWPSPEIDTSFVNDLKGKSYKESIEYTEKVLKIPVLLVKKHPTFKNLSQADLNKKLLSIENSELSQKYLDELVRTKGLPWDISETRARGQYLGVGITNSRSQKVPEPRVYNEISMIILGPHALYSTLLEEILHDRYQRVSFPHLFDTPKPKIIHHYITEAYKLLDLNKKLKSAWDTFNKLNNDVTPVEQFNEAYSSLMKSYLDFHCHKLDYEIRVKAEEIQVKKIKYENRIELSLESVDVRDNLWNYYCYVKDLHDLIDSIRNDELFQSVKQNLNFLDENYKTKYLLLEKGLESTEKKLNQKYFWVIQQMSAVQYRVGLETVLGELMRAGRISGLKNSRE